ncbi:MAG TPA: CPXCG motif-containing cysteine-rich protein [Nitrospiria bacterium]
MALTPDFVAHPMSSTNTAVIHCPYCGAQVQLVIDCSVPFQEYIEDCEVCCRPIVLAVSVDEAGTISVDARDENEG